MALQLMRRLIRSKGVVSGLVGLAAIPMVESVQAADVLATASAFPVVIKSESLLPSKLHADPGTDGRAMPLQYPGLLLKPVSMSSAQALGPQKIAQQQTEVEAPDTAAPVGVPETVSNLRELDLNPEVIQDSPVLQDWLQEVPDIADEIRNQPSFRTRLRVGYAQFPSDNQAGGVHLGIEDVFLVAGSGLTASGSFNRSWNDERESFAAEARYYLLPLGSYVNLAPTLGYRSLETPDYTTNGLDVGFRLMLIPSPGGGADIGLSQRWIAPGSQQEVGMTSLSLGYAVTSKLRLGTDLEWQNSQSGQSSRLGLVLEWLM